MNESKVYLRALSIEDSVVTYQWRQDEVYKQGVVSQVRYSNLESERQWIINSIENHNKGKEVRLAVIEKDSGRLIGLVYLTNINYINRTGIMGYMIGESNARGKGYAKEAVLQLLHYVFQQLGINRVSANVLATNQRSLSAMKKIGFIQEGILREAIFRNGHFIDLISFSILKSDFYE
ncbi:GNAT family N-acetyltransferase [Myroides pelagicus]|uniref:GNAT family N-acetyltransferase n=1 Tax=Myroides pelagicus TaxID=270914 RepID=A0A7K1GIU7_9FLAO|nr:GNAT family protein [Myroides pelagicus]MTH28459.1 GNAT family N-acetyltransferase [Myroides pelagicus]